MFRDYAVLDVFTDTPLEGNPVAVFTDGSGLSDEVMQRTARELNLSETVFLLPDETGECDARARIFTPGTEMPFAGHPVLGTAFLLAQRDGTERVRLATGAGPVAITLERETDRLVFGEMEQPIPTWETLAAPGPLLAALGVTETRLPVEIYDNGPRHVMVMLSSAAEVIALRPNPSALADSLAGGVSCFALDGTQVRTRMFAPGLGVFEDPATGSAAGPLAVHLARHGVVAFGQPLQISQGTEVGRPSQLRAVAHGSAERIERVLVGGCAVPVATGSYRLG